MDEKGQDRCGEATDLAHAAHTRRRPWANRLPGRWSRNQEAALAMALRGEHETASTLAAAVELTPGTVLAWRRDPEFRARWARLCVAELRATLPKCLRKLERLELRAFGPALARHVAARRIMSKTPLIQLLSEGLGILDAILAQEAAATSSR